MKSNYLIPCAFLLSLIFFSASISKIISFSDFIGTLKKLGFLRLQIIIAIFVISIEFFLGIGFLFSKYWGVSGKVAAITVFVFTIIVLYGQITERITDCSCFKRFFETQVGPILYLRNILIIFLSIFIAKYNR